MRKSDGIDVLLGAFLTGSASGAIEASEAAGQRELCASAVLPKQLHGSDVDPKSIEENLGIKFGEDDDNLFVNVTLPSGWKVVPTEHSMWNNLVDGKGRVRAEIFYKAAFYDRDAFMRFNVRYFVTSEYAELRAPGNFDKKFIVKDAATGSILFETGYSDDKTDTNRKAAREFLSTNFPEHENVFAYWN
jgi:hypothetical protein